MSGSVTLSVVTVPLGCGEQPDAADALKPGGRLGPGPILAQDVSDLRLHLSHLLGQGLDQRFYAMLHGEDDLGMLC